MVMSKTYHTVNGRILGETAAGVRTDYLTDALGSVTATVNASGAVVNRYRYKPYGALLSKSGVGADPKQQWVGSLGYRQTGRKYSDMYVRARHYDTVNGRWTSKDPVSIDLGDSDGYRNVRCRPTSSTDSSGLVRIVPFGEMHFGTFNPSFGGGNRLCCGAYAAAWSFELETANKLAPCDGVFVQYVRLDADVNDCDPPEKGADFVGSCHCDYTEIFDPIPVRLNTAAQVVDHFTNPQHPHTIGHRNTTAEVRFICLSDIYASGPLRSQGFDRKNTKICQDERSCGAQAGGLFARKGSPPTAWWRGSADGIMVPRSHTGTATWCCCGNGGKTSSTAADPFTPPQPAKICPD